MTGSSRHGGTSRRMLIAAAAALIPLIAGCEAGTDAPTQSWHQPTDGTATSQANIQVANAFILGAPIGHVLGRGQSAGLFLALTNNGVTGDQLVSIAAPGTARTVALPGGVVNLPSQRPALLTGPQPDVVLQGLLRPLAGGSTVTLFLTFAKAGVLRLLVPVMPRAQFYATLSPAPSPSPAASPSTSPTGPRSRKPRPGLSPSPTPSTT